MLRPNLTLKYAKFESRDAYGKEQYGEDKTERCAIVRLRSRNDRTSVRTDASATRGYAEEFAAQNRILVMASTQVEQGDRVTVIGVSLRVTVKAPRYDITGRLDHYEIEGVPCP